MTSETIMWFGKHKGLELQSVPGKWLLWWYSVSESETDKLKIELRLYIEQNLKDISADAVTNSRT